MEELTEHEQDLVAFQKAYSFIHRRVQEVKDEGRMMKLVTWSGTSAVMGSSKWPPMPSSGWLRS